MGEWPPRYGRRQGGILEFNATRGRESLSKVGYLSIGVSGRAPSDVFVLWGK